MKPFFFLYLKYKKHMKPKQLWPFLFPDFLLVRLECNPSWACLQNNLRLFFSFLHLTHVFQPTWNIFSQHCLNQFGKDNSSNKNNISDLLTNHTTFLVLIIYWLKYPANWQTYIFYLSLMNWQESYQIIRNNVLPNWLEWLTTRTYNILSYFFTEY